MALEPLQDVVVLEFYEVGIKTGLVLPDVYEPEKDENTVFRVVASGPGVWDAGRFIPNKLKPGDLVITPVYGVSKFKYAGKKIILSRERDIVLRITPAEEEGEVMN